MTEKMTPKDLAALAPEDFEALAEDLEDALRSAIRSAAARIRELEADEAKACDAYYSECAERDQEIAALTEKLDRAKEALRLVNKTLTVEAAEYVPAIPDAWKIIEAVLAKLDGSEGESE